MAIVSTSHGAESLNYLQCQPSFEPASSSYAFVREDERNLAIADDSRIGSIHYTRLPIFDESNPAENNSLFRWANRVHLLTREQTISQQLLFNQEDTFDARLLEESARLLRAQGYFYDADIRPVSQCGDQVDVEVITKDNWSLTPSIAFDRSGGENTYSIGFRDSNILGRGKLFNIANGKDIDRRSTELVYRDNNVFGSRVTNQTTLVDSDDGSTQLFGLRLPFYSLNSTRTWAMELENRERVDEQFYRGDELSEVEHRIESLSLEAGFSRGLDQGRVNRWTVGYRYQDDEFAVTDELPPPSIFPVDKKLSYPYLRFETIEDNYSTAFNLDQIYRTEDLHLGYRFAVDAGYAAEALGSDQNWFVLNLEISDTLLYDGDQLWQHNLQGETLWNRDSSQTEDLLLSYENRYFRRQTTHRSFFARFEAVYSQNLNSHRQVVLGGLTGARAFDNRFQVGDRRLLLTLEERIYTDIHLWNLVRLGSAIFLDAGRAWDPDLDNGVEDDLLANIGFGLRLASSKAASERVAHLDFAFPLSNQDDPNVDSFQVAFTIKGSF